MLHELLNMDLSGWSVWDVPYTDELKEQNACSLEPLDQWITELATSEEYVEGFMPTVGLFDRWLYYANRNKIGEYRMRNIKSVGRRIGVILNKKSRVKRERDITIRGFDLPKQEDFIKILEDFYKIKLDFM